MSVLKTPEVTFIGLFLFRSMRTDQSRQVPSGRTYLHGIIQKAVRQMATVLLGLAQTDGAFAYDAHIAVNQTVLGDFEND